MKKFLRMTKRIIAFVLAIVLIHQSINWFAIKNPVHAEPENDSTTSVAISIPEAITISSEKLHVTVLSEGVTFDGATLVDSNLVANFSKTSDFSWEHLFAKVSFDGCVEKEVSLNTSSVRLLPIISLNNVSNAIPGQKQAISVNSTDTNISLDPTKIFYRCQSLGVEDWTSVGNSNPFYVKPLEANQSYTISVCYEDTQNNENIKSFDLQTGNYLNPTISGATKVNDTYYVGSQYSVEVAGFEKYCINDTWYSLPITNGITTAGTDIRFMEPYGGLTGVYNFVRNDENDFFPESSIVLNNTSGSGVTISVAPVNVPQFGAAEVYYYYEGEELSPHHLYTGQLEYNSTSVAKNIYFYAQSVIGNKTEPIMKTIPAIDLTSPTITSVNVNGQTPNNNGQIKYNGLKDVVLTVHVEDGGAYSSGLKIDSALNVEGNIFIMNKTEEAENSASYTCTISALQSNELEGKTASITIEDIDGNLSDIFSFEFVKDVIAPSFNVETKNGENIIDLESSIISKDDFETGIDIEISASEDISAYRYSFSENDNGTLIEEFDIPKIRISFVPQQSGEFPVYVYVYDIAGNESERKTIMMNVDVISPTISIIASQEGMSSETMSQEQTVLNVKNVTEIEVIAVDDSGEESNISVINCDTSTAVTLMNNKFTFAPTDAETSETIRYQIDALDHVGNKSTRYLTVVYDIDAPTITATLKNNGEEVEDEWLNRNSEGTLLIEVDATDGNIHASGIKSVVVKESDSDNGTNVSLTKVDDHYVGTYDIPKTNDILETYIVEVYDVAGNSNLTTVDVKLDVTAPTISYDGSEDWRTVALSETVESADSTSGVLDVKYELYKIGEQDNLASLKEEGIVDNSNLTISEEGAWTLKIWAEDVAGNVSNFIYKNVLIDSVAPKTDRSHIFAQYEEVKENSLLGDIQAIFGKNKIHVKLYMQDDFSSPNIEKLDDFSDIKTINIRYNNTVQTVTPNSDAVALKNSSGIYTPETSIDGAQLEDVYRIFEFDIPSGNRDISYIQSRLQVIFAEDNAGNTVDCEIIPTILNETVDDYLIILDNVSPLLTKVDYGEVEMTQDKYYFDSDFSVNLSIKEHYFSQANKPVITLYSKELKDDSYSSQILDVEWNVDSNDSEQYNASVTIPLLSDKEMEYYFTLEFSDSSANVLTGQDIYDVSDLGVYTSAHMVTDNLAPELKNVEITHNDSEKTDILEASKRYYIDSSKGGIRISATIEDSSFVAENYILKVYNNSQYLKGIAINDDNVSFVDGNYVVEIVYDVASNTSGEYTFSLEYKDIAGIFMVFAEEHDFSLEGIAEGTIGSGVFRLNGRFIFDKVAPVLKEVTYGVPYQYIENQEKVESIQSSSTKLFYNENIVGTFSIEEDFFDNNDVKVDIYRKISDYFVLVSDSEKYFSYEVNQFRFLVKKDPINHSTDGEYFFVVKYKDKSNNRMICNDSSIGNGLYKNSVMDGIYTSPILVMDSTAPIVEVSYTGIPSAEYSDVSFYKENVDVKFSFKEENFNVNELKQWISSQGAVKEGLVIEAWKFDSTGKKNTVNNKEITDAIENYRPAYNNTGNYDLTVKLQDEANYNLSMDFVDMAGNKAEVKGLKNVTIDKTVPKISAKYTAGNGGFIDFIRYGELGYLFGKGKITIEVTVEDEVSGADIVTILDDKAKVNGTGSKVNQVYKKTISKVVPASGTKDFKGLITVKGSDIAQNNTELHRNYIVESQGTYQNNSESSITLDTTPSREINGVKYYNASSGNVKFTVNATEKYSGLRYVEVKPSLGTFSMNTNAMPEISANQSMDTIYKWNVRNKANGVEGTEDNREGSVPTDVAESSGITNDNLKGNNVPIVNKFTNSGVFASNMSNNLDNISIQMETMSNTGYKSTLESELFTIDLVDPVINVTWNDAEVYNGKYYNVARVATVTITERNFSSSDIVWNITNTEGKMPIISDFTNDNIQGTDDTQHVGTVTFKEDGDYTFDFSFMDRAGNEVSYTSEPFTIDTTAPIVEVFYDNNDVYNEMYYNQERVATVQINEHNFTDDSLEIVTSATLNGTNIHTPSIGGFSHNGDVHTAYIHYDYDGEFTFVMKYMDVAGNESEPIEDDHFIIDLTDPELSIENVEPFSANKGSVTPSIRGTDTNFDSDGFVVTLKGYKNGDVSYNSTKTNIQNGQQIVWEDFAYEPYMDDMYTLNVQVTDKAGRTVEDEIVFSVNRYGSTYQFDTATSDLLERYYNNKENDVVITETNVDTLEFQELYMMKNGERVDLTKGKEYTISESGNEVSWKQYKYIINKSNFENEGVYNIVIYSEDRAENESDNRVKNCNVEFVIDKTAPIIQINGVEEDKQYISKERLVSIDIKDNMELEKMDVYLNDSSKPLSTLKSEDISEKNGVISYNIENSNRRQKILVKAVDKAGNQSQANVRNFLITSNLFVQFYQTAPLFYGTIGAVAVLGVGIGYFGFFGRKRK